MNSLIRPLEWKEDLGYHIAETGVGRYLIIPNGSGLFRWQRTFPGIATDGERDLTSVEAAKSSAEQHYRELVGRCLVDVPEDAVVHRGVVRKIIITQPTTTSRYEMIYLEAEAARTKEEA